MKYLSHEEEREVGRLAKLGDQAAIDILIKTNLPFVHKIAGKFSSHGNTHDDLVQVGVMQMLLALEVYDPDRPTRFKTIAYWWIQRGIHRAVVDDSTIKPPSRGFRARHLARRVDSLDVIPSGEERPLSDSLPAAEIDLGEELDKNGRVDRIQRALRRIPRRERDIVRMRYGIGRFKHPMTLAKIGNQLHISTERVRVILARAMAKLEIKLRNQKK